MKYDLDDTIAAISTPVGEGGIGIVRLSGKGSLSIADKIFKSGDDARPSEFKTYTTHYGHIIRRVTSTEHEAGTPFDLVRLRSPQVAQGRQYDIIDEVILTVMRAPRSYTKEDIVEINCHAGIVPLRKVLELVLSSGARLAQPGEFTRRAFLNGRIDLAQAESVLDAIRSKTDTSLRAAMSQLGGELSSKIRNLRDALLDLSSHVEASIDFPEEDIEIMSECGLQKKVKEIVEELKVLIDSADKGRILAEGIRTVICGRPNVGKSSLMNSLLKENRVIVSHIPGTTRDTIEEIININGIPLKIVDTAGIIETDDLLTKEGVERTRFHIRAADLILLILDGSEPLSVEDEKIIDEVKDRKTIVVVNKIDLPKRLVVEKLKDLLIGKEIVEISVTENKNLKNLENSISEMIWGGEVTGDYTVMVTNVRHKALLVQVREVLERALDNLAKETPPEFIALDIREGIECLGEITGEGVASDILDRIFDKFCIGK